MPPDIDKIVSDNHGDIAKVTVSGFMQGPAGSRVICSIEQMGEFWDSIQRPSQGSIQYLERFANDYKLQVRFMLIKEQDTFGRGEVCLTRVIFSGPKATVHKPQYVVPFKRYLNNKEKGHVGTLEGTGFSVLPEMMDIGLRHGELTAMERAQARFTAGVRLGRSGPSGSGRSAA